MKLGYVIVNENLGTELIRRQVIELLFEIKNQNNEIDIYVLNFQSVPSMLNHARMLKKITIELRNNGIRHCVIPNISPWPIPNLKFKKLPVGWRPYSVWNRLSALFFSVGTLPFFAIFNKIMGISIFHCRSYPATLAAITYKNISKNTKVIFDPRSDFPEEGITAGFWKKDSRDFIFWKKVEKKLLEKSNSTALIGPTYLQNYQESTSRFNYFFAPNNVDIKNFNRNEPARIKIRRELGFDQEDIVFVYLGALTNNGWHRITCYKIFHDLIVAKNRKYKLLLLTPKVYVNDVIKHFSSLVDVRIVSPAYNVIGDYLSAGDIGLMFLHRRKIAVGTKIGEYLCCDLPVIVNANCAGATDLIRSNDTYGYVVGLGLGDLDDSIDFNEGAIVQLINKKPARRARTYFDIKLIAESYIVQYEIV